MEKITLRYEVPDDTSNPDRTKGIPLYNFECLDKMWFHFSSLLK